MDISIVSGLTHTKIVLIQVYRTEKKHSSLAVNLVKNGNSLCWEFKKKHLYGISQRNFLVIFNRFLYLSAAFFYVFFPT